VARSKPTIEARSAKGILSNNGKVARTCPRGDGRVGKEVDSIEGKNGRDGSWNSEKTGAVASKPSGE